MQTRVNLGKLMVALGAMSAIVIVIGTTEAPRPKYDIKVVLGIDEPITQADRDIAYGIAQAQMAAKAEETARLTLLAATDPTKMAAATAAEYRELAVNTTAMDYRLTHGDQVMEQVTNALTPVFATSTATLNKVPKPPTGLEILKRYQQRKAPA